VGREYSNRATVALDWRKIPLPPELYFVSRQAMHQTARRTTHGFRKQKTNKK